MKKFLVLLAMSAALVCSAFAADSEIYGFTVKNQDGKDVSLSDYKGKVMLIVNTATKCGYTPQYKGLQALYEECSDAGLCILDFPCNQFGGQAPGTDEEISSFCEMKYGVTYPQFSKIDVNGKNAIPLYKWLVKNTGNKDIKWNFTKFLIDREGNIVKRYESSASIKSIKEDMKGLL